MNRYDVIKGYFRFIRESGLPAHEVVLSAGAAMVILGHRKQTSDLDIDVPEWFFVQHKQNYNYRLRPHGEFVQYNRWTSLQVNRLDESEMQVNLSKLNGKIYTYTPQRLLEQKLRLLEIPNRNPTKLERDVVDCEALLAALSGKELSEKETALFNRFFAAKRELQWSLA